MAVSYSCFIMYCTVCMYLSSKINADVFVFTCVVVVVVVMMVAVVVVEV